jgi:hypothetical protein
MPDRADAILKLRNPQVCPRKPQAQFAALSRSRERPAQALAAHVEQIHDRVPPQTLLLDVAVAVRLRPLEDSESWPPLNSAKPGALMSA